MKNLLSATLLATLITATSLSAFAQEAEIEIVNQDGEPVDGARLMVKPKSDRVELDDGTTPESNKLLLKSEDGTITVTDGDGKEQSIDLDNAQSIVIQRSAQSVNNNGKQETKVVGKAIVIGPHGQRHEIDLGENGRDGLALPGMPTGFGFPGMFTAKQSGSKYMIGVHCAPVPAALQTQLGLANGTGLLVDAVGQDSPAAAAGLQKHDILLFADDQELQRQADLVKAVQKAGEGSVALSLSVMRGGQEVGLEVSPVERTAEQRIRLPRGAMDFGFGGFDENFGADFGGNFGANFGDVEFKQFGPGVILGGDFDQAMDNMRQQMQDVQKQMQEMQLRMKQRLDMGE